MGCQYFHNARWQFRLFLIKQIFAFSNIGKEFLIEKKTHNSRMKRTEITFKRVVLF